VKILVLEYWTPLVVWLITIFFFSTDLFSSGQTSRFIVPLLMFFFPGLPPQEIEVWHGVIRKAGHVAEYFILALLAYRTFKHDQPDWVRAKVDTGLFVLVYALLDEFHQSLTLSRGASIIDVSYDCFGAVWALWLITSYENRRIRSYPVL
jgi:VanZ family protein